ncbi:MAG: dihydrofolate reductase [Cyclobacteriaceae bacterium]
MITSLIVAQAENRAIGKDNQMIWHLPKEFAHFKRTTLGHHIIMGRKNFESIGKPLPKRTSIVISRNDKYEVPENVLLTNSLENALSIAKENGDEEAFVIGGGQLYELAIDQVDRMYLTTVHESFDADVFFPTFDRSKWILRSTKRFEADEKNKHAFTVEVFDRINVS